MTKIIRNLSLLLLSLILLSLNRPAGASVAARYPGQTQVSPWVLAATRDGGETDLMIVMAEQADLSPAYSLPTREARGRFVYRRLMDTAQKIQAPLRAWLDAQGVPYRPFYVVNLIHVQAGDRALVEALAARSDVARIEANPLVRQELPPPAGSLLRPSGGWPEGVEWNVARVNADDVWALGYNGQGVVVGGQDTGYQWDHPALIDAYRGWNGTAVVHDYNWYDAVAGSSQPIDPYGHGTHTMGTILGDDGGANQIGVAPGAQWIGCRNMDSSGYGSPTRYLTCFEFFLAPYPLDGGPEQGNPDLAPDVTNNSWYCPPSEGCSWSTLLAAVEAQRAAGILTVVSAGNTGPSCSSVTHPPGIYDAAYTVGATTSSDAIASFSSRGPVTRDGSGRLKPEISAPGSGVRSCVPGGGYGLKSGTSMAAPHVAGGVALLWSARPDLRPYLDLTEYVLNITALPRYSTQCGDLAGTVPNNVYGWGRLDVLAAVEAALDRGGVGHLAGQVNDPRGLPLTGVEVGAAHPPNPSLSTHSGADGGYDLSLFAETYTVTALASGYNPFLASGLTVTAGATTSLNITLCQSVADVGLTHAPAEPQPGQSLTFSATVAAGTPPRSYLWDLGDGTARLSGQVISHTYQEVGRYTVTLTVSNCFPGGPYGEGPAAWVTASLPLTLAVLPQVQVSPSALSARLDPGQRAERGLLISNTGEADLAWTLSQSPSVTWLAAEPLSGTLPPLQTGAVTVTFDAQGVSSGTYTSALQLDSNDPARPRLSVPVSLTVVSQETCTPVASVALSLVRPGTLRLGDEALFSADIMPDDFTAPYTYTIDYGDGEVVGPLSGSDDPYTFTYSYDAADTYTVEFWTWNCDMTVPVTDSVEVVAMTEPVTPCVEVEAVTLTLETVGDIYTGDTVDFGANIEPDDAHKPYSYTVQVQEGSASLPRLGYQDPLTFAYAFEATGTYTVGIWVWNCGLAPVSDTLQIEVLARPRTYWAYLPLIIRRE